VEILRQRRLEVFSPARCSGRKPTESKTDWREIEPRIQPASAVEADFLRIEFIEIVQHAAYRIAFVVVERVLELAGHNAAAVEHQIFADDPARICESVAKLFIGGKQ